MSSKPDPKIPHAEISHDSAQDPLSGTERLRPVSSQPDDSPMAAFDALSLFPSEGKATTEKSSKNASLLSGEHATPRSPAPERQGSAKNLQNERPALKDLRAPFRQTEAAIQQLLSEAGDLKADLDQVRAVAAQLTRDYGTIKEFSREAREDSGRAIAAIKDIEQRLGGLAALRALATQTDERLAALDALAEDVTHKTRALENQRYMIERTLVETSRLNEMVQASDSQTAKLKAVSQQIARTEEMFRRIEKLAAQATAQLEHATKLKDKLGREIGRFEQEAQTITESMGNHVKQLVVKKKEFEALEQRLRAFGVAVDAGAIAVESSHNPIEHAMGGHQMGVTTTAGRPRWVLHHRRMSNARAILFTLFTQTSAWAVRHATPVIAGLGALALVSFIIMRSVGDPDQIRMNETVQHAQPSLDPAPQSTPETVPRSAATGTQTALPTLEPPSGGGLEQPSAGEGNEMVQHAPPSLDPAPPRTPGTVQRSAPTGTPTALPTLKQPSVGEGIDTAPVRAREYIGALEVESDPPGAEVFINRRAVGATPLRLERLAAGSHALWVEREGYQRWTAAIMVSADRLTRVSVRLRQ